MNGLACPPTFLRGAFREVLVLFSSGAAVLFDRRPLQFARAEILKVGGTGSVGPLVANLFRSLPQTEVPGVELEQPSPPLGSGGALKASWRTPR